MDKQVETSGWSKVTAVFADSEMSFLMPRDATVAELAERLVMMAEPHGGLPVAVDVRISH